ncbi:MULTISPECIES: hypothetical protein [unclassified Lentimicrobium]|uniref:hypothetical protein n=1 Tax=unclassified Lentimicrobium TaxID=2677434 RepID=UPI0015581B54|nr:MULTISPECIES: hypothetical protein [unclassified Lentimicrobium]NPD47148.1 hypothetical protein [Lentimicrobium sp. S6]NPD83673.1 hypothetical protein [Lentimicrobium sp. L6]
MKTKSPLNTNSVDKAPDTLSVLREHYLHIAKASAQMINSSEIKSWMQYRNKVDQILFQN